MDRGKGSIKLRGKSLALEFSYRGQRFRPTLKGLSADKKLHRKRAEEILLQVQADIAANRFDPYVYFPDYPPARKFRKGSGISVEEKLNTWLETKRRTCEATTFRLYKSVIDFHLIPSFGDKSISDISTSEVREWMESLPNSNKTINNALTPLRAILAEAFEDGLIDKDPLKRIKNLPPRSAEPRPFTLDEVHRILNNCDGQFRNLIQFAFFTGLRTSELIGLKWEYISLPNKQAHIRCVVTREGEKDRPKTSTSIRNVALLPPAEAALKAQLEHTQDQIYVFHNPVTKTRWKSAERIKRFWARALKRAEIPYRKPYTTRHTFASLMLSAGVNPMHVAQQMGHRDWGMIRKVYGRYISDADTEINPKITRLWAQLRQ